MRVSLSYCPGWPQTLTVLISASQIAGLELMSSLHHPPRLADGRVAPPWPAWTQFFSGPMSMKCWTIYKLKTQTKVGMGSRRQDRMGRQQLDVRGGGKEEIPHWNSTLPPACRFIICLVNDGVWGGDCPPRCVTATTLSTDTIASTSHSILWTGVLLLSLAEVS
jgi:hypothetical protein